MTKDRLIHLISLLALAVFVRLVLFRFLGEGNLISVRVIASLVTLVVGAVFVLMGCAKIIEETTEVLSERTKIASGLLQSIGTAFPDMVLGIVAALVSLSVRRTDYQLAINYAIIAAATTFGSNIYNVGHAIWCLSRQRKSDLAASPVLMFPPFKSSGLLTPITNHIIKPSVEEADTAISVLNSLSFLTAAVALFMVFFGQVTNVPQGVSGELYQLTRPTGLVIFAVCIFTLFKFRKSKRAINPNVKVVEEENYYRNKSAFILWISVIFAGVAILLTAESMIHSLQVISEVFRIPFVITGVLAGVIGCLGEMIVVHNFSVHPNGRIGDAVVGVAMDNVVTILGASIVALMGGIFLGGRDLIVLFVVILALNTALIEQISKMKTVLFKVTGKIGIV